MAAFLIALTKEATSIDPSCSALSSTNIASSNAASSAVRESILNMKNKIEIQNLTESWRDIIFWKLGDE